MADTVNNTPKEQTQELAIFQQYRKDKITPNRDRSVVFSSKPDFKKESAGSRSDDKPDRKPPKADASEEHKQKAMQFLLEYIQDICEFINIGNQHLYYYFPKEGYWKLIPANKADLAFRMILTTDWVNYINSSTMNELYKWLLVATETKDISIFNSGREYLNFKDCAYNWMTKEIIHDRQNLYFTYSLALDYPHKEDSTGAFKEFINSVFEDDEETKHEFSKFVGLAISDIRDLKYIIHLYGPSNTGKSTALNAIKHVVGADVCSSLSFSQLSQEFYLSSLHGCRLNISGEISGVSTAKLDALKSLSGNDTVAASHKFRDSFLFDNRCLLVFACNLLPRISDYMEMQSYVSRMLIFPFRKVFDRSCWKVNFQEILNRDIAGIVKFGIKGLRRLAEDNFMINETPAMLRCKQDYTGQIDSFSLFCNKYIDREPKGFVSSSTIKKAYQAFCFHNEYEELQNNQWPQVLKRHFHCKPVTKSITVEGIDNAKSVRGYQGITLSDDAEKLFNGNAQEAIFQQELIDALWEN